MSAFILKILGLLGIRDPCIASTILVVSFWGMISSSCWTVMAFKLDPLLQKIHKQIPFVKGCISQLGIH
jgi:hypothetical protein